MMSSLLSAELSATCNALGYSSGSNYYTDPYVKETITDLIRYLRRDDEDHTIRRHLGCAKILQTDLLPILIYHSEKEELFDVLLRLLVNLTNPAIMLYMEEIPTERTARHYFLQLISQLQGYKEAFTEQRVWDVLSKKLADLLQIAYHERDLDQSRTIERVLILARNVLQVPADNDLEKRPDNDASIHDQVLWSLHQAGMVDLFLYIASTDNEQQFYMHTLEIVSLMLKEQKPATLASAVLQRSQEEKEKDEKLLLEIRRKEILEKQSKVKKYAGTRHSRFGGTFVVKNVKSISENDLIYHKPPSTAVNLSFDSTKQRSKVPKNKVSLVYSSSERRSAFSVRLFLKEFCVEFLNGAYNPLMHKVRENLVRGAGQPNDETYYFWAMKFFMEFNRLYKFQVKLISETMHQQIFHFVQTQMENWLEQMVVDKKKIAVWSRRIHQALKAYQELLMTLQAMDMSPDESVRKSAQVIKSNIFYQSEYRELVIFLFNVFNEVNFTREYLKDLLETTHIFLKMLERFCSKYQNVIVQSKARKVQKKKKKSSKAKKVDKATPRDMEAIWDQVAPDLSAVLQNPGELPVAIPFDATSDVPMDQQKVEAMKKIHMELKQGNVEQAISLLRASREVWPENDHFGHANITPDDEFLAMREIFLADIGQPAEETAAEDGDTDGENSEDDEEDPRAIVVPEQSFRFIEFLARFACPRVVSAVCLLMDQFDRNTNFTNNCIVKLLHRIAWDCKLPAMLFQATLFRTFQRLFKTDNPDHKELIKFAIYIVRKYVEVAKTNEKISMELLFWKNKKEAEEIEVGYGNGSTKSHSTMNMWKEEQEDELRRLVEEYEKDSPEQDAVGWVMKNMIDQTRSRRAVIKKIKELGMTEFIVMNSKQKQKKSNTIQFSEEEEDQLKVLYEQFKDAADPMSCILGRMSLPRSRKTVVNKLIDMGLVSDRKQLRKKQKSKGKETKSTNNSEDLRSDGESIYDSSSSDSDDGDDKGFTTQNKTKAIRKEPSMGQIHCKLKKVIEESLQEPLEWLKGSLMDVIENLDDDDDEEESTALLPLTPPCVQAMDNPVFLQLLDVLLFETPTGQDIYWRIPGRWKVQDLTMRIDIITCALEDRLPDIDSELSSAKGDEGDTPRDRVAPKPQNRADLPSDRSSDDSSSDDSSDTPMDQQKNKAAVRNRRFRLSSEDESSQERTVDKEEDYLQATPGTSKMDAVTLQATPGTSKMNAVSLQTIPGTSKMNQVSLQAIPGTSKMNAVSLRAIPGTSKINAVGLLGIPGTSKMNSVSLWAIPGTSKMNAVSSQGIPGTSKMNAVSSQSIPGTFKMNAVRTNTQRIDTDSDENEDLISSTQKSIVNSDVTSDLPVVSGSERKSIKRSTNRIESDSDGEIDSSDTYLKAKKFLDRRNQWIKESIPTINESIPGPCNAGQTRDSSISDIQRNEVSSSVADDAMAIERFNLELVSDSDSESNVRIFRTSNLKTKRSRIESDSSSQSSDNDMNNQSKRQRTESPSDVI